MSTRNRIKHIIFFVLLALSLLGCEDPNKNGKVIPNPFGDGLGLADRLAECWPNE